MPAINLREAAVGLLGDVGEPFVFTVIASEDYGAVPIEAAVEDHTGRVVEFFSADVSGRFLTLSLSPVQTDAIGTVSGRWWLTIDGVSWLGGPFDLSSPGVSPRGARIAPASARVVAGGVVNVDVIAGTVMGDPAGAAEQAKAEAIAAVTPAIGAAQTTATEAAGAAATAQETADSAASVATDLAVSVRTYGTTGDGITDDRAAVQAAIDALTLAGGGVLALPPGDYFIGTALDEIATPLIIRGSGSGLVGQAVTTLTFAAGVPGLVFGTTAGGSSVESLRLKSNSTVLGTDDGLLFKVGRCRIQDVIIESFGRYGVNLGTLNGNVNLTQMDKVRVHGCKSHGFYLQGNDANSIKGIGCSAVANAGYGFYQDNTATNCFINPHTDLNTAGGYYDGGSGNHYYDLYAESGDTFVIGTGSGYGVIICGLNAAPAISALDSGYTSWTILTGGAWSHGMRWKPLPVASNQTNWGIVLGSPNNGHVQFYNVTSGQRVWSAHPTTQAMTVWNELEIDGAINHDGSTIGLNGSAPVAKSTGWGAATGTATKTTFDTTTVTTAQLAERVKALLDYLTSRGDIGT